MRNILAGRRLHDYRDGHPRPASYWLVLAGAMTHVSGNAPSAIKRLGVAACGLQPEPARGYESARSEDLLMAGRMIGAQGIAIADRLPASPLRGLGREPWASTFRRRQPRPDVFKLPSITTRLPARADESTTRRPT